MTTKQPAKKDMVDKIADLIKFCVVAGLFYLVVFHAPEQIALILSYAGAYLMGSKVPLKLG